jgi:hypothetical protein
MQPHDIETTLAQPTAIWKRNAAIPRPKHQAQAATNGNVDWTLSYRNRLRAGLIGFQQLVLSHDLVADVNALATNVDRRTSDELPHIAL